MEGRRRTFRRSSSTEDENIMVSVILLPTCSRFSDLREERLALVSPDFLLFSVTTGMT